MHSESFPARNWAATLLLGLVALTTACGGGGSGDALSSPTPPPSIPDFSLSIEFPTINVQQQGQAQGEAVQVNSLNGFAATVNFTIQGVPSGVSVSPTPQISVASGTSQSQYLTIAASTAAAVASSTVTLTGTSGSLSHSATFSIAVQKVAAFQLTFSMNAVALAPATQVVVNATATSTTGNAPPTVIFSVSGLPTDTGVELNQQGNLTLTNTSVSQALVITAGVTARSQSFPLIVTATSGTDTSSATFQVSVSNSFQPNTKATRSTFLVTDGDVTGTVYDSARRLVFATVESLNEVVVVSSIDGSQVATISVDRPRGIDEALDGSAVYVGSYGAYIAVIDPDTLQVTSLVLGPTSAIVNTNYGSYASPVLLTSLSNGDVLVVGQVGATGETHLYMWAPDTGTVTNDDVPGLISPFFMVRSADHSKVLIQGSTAPPVASYLYDAATNTFTGTPVGIGNQATAALSPNGAQMATWDGQMSVVIYDGQFNQLASLPIQGQNNQIQELIYSRDGNFLYDLTSLYPESQSSVVTVIDTQTFQILGIESEFSGGTIPFDIDESGMIFGGPPNAFGLAFLDVGAPGGIQFPVFPNFQIAPNQFSLSSPTQAVLTLGVPSQSSTDQYQVFFGAPPASAATQSATSLSVQSPSTLAVTVPPGKSPGPANVTLVRSDGWYGVEPNSASYGPPEIVAVNANAGPSSGGSEIFIWGYGFDLAAANTNQVTIGGAPATFWQQPELANSSGDYPYPLQVLSVTTPAGTPGLADVTVTTSFGSTTLPHGFQYLTTGDVFPVTGELQQIVYDQKRQRLYAANADHNRIEVFSLASQTFLPPIPTGNAPVSIALSPDDAKLAAANSGDGTVSVIDPDTDSVLAIYPVLTADDSNPLCGGQVFSLTPIEEQRMFVGILCVNLTSQGDTHLLDLNTGSLSCVGIMGCKPNGNTYGGLQTMVSSTDGTKVLFVGAIYGSSGGILDLATNTVAPAEQALIPPLAIDADANMVSAVIKTPLGPYGRANFNSQQFEVSLLQDRQYLQQASPYDELYGTQLNPSGSLIFQPFLTPSLHKVPTQGVDISDVHSGHLVLRVALSDPIAPVVGPLVLDETGSRMFLISSTGITVAQLYTVPLSIASTSPASGPPGTQVTIRGSGFETGSTVTFGTTVTTATFVDGNTLQANVPTLSSGSLRVTVTNPGGRQYSCDDLFTVQ